MNIERAIENLRVLGDNFKLDLEARGKTTPEAGALMHGLAAYHMLDLRGEYTWLDQSVDVVMREVFDMARKRVLEGQE
jgi:hypothetical protein